MAHHPHLHRGAQRAHRQPAHWRRPTALAVLALCAGHALAQGSAATLPAVPVTGTGLSQPAEIGGFADVSARELPLSATVIDRAQLDAAGARRLADLTRIDPSTTDSYNSGGYWDILSVRGYVLDNRMNYRRDGLPISAETSIALDNKERIEILKGTSGIQAGVSSPGGLVNYVVKRPTAQPRSSVGLEISERGSTLVSADLSRRAGAGGALGWRLNLAHETLRPELRNASGERQLVALATDWRIDRNSLLEAEVEWSRRSQPSQPGFSLLGNTLPGPVGPRLNLNNQPWSTPGVFEGLTGSVRYERALNPDWRLQVHAARQRLRSDDRVAFPFGCTDAGGTYYADRYCPNGDFDLYDYRSDNERRTTDALRVGVQGQFATGAVRHQVSLGVLRSHLSERYQMQAFNFVGTGNVSGTPVTPADPSLTGQNTNRDDRSTEFYLHDAMRLGDWRAWAGLRHTRLSRESVRTDGSRPISYSQSVTTPWLALSREIGGMTAYASAGEGIETRVTPNLPAYGAAAGTPLPALKSRQFEAGLRMGNAGLNAQVAVFRIRRPETADTGAVVQFDGDSVHQGVEAQLGGSAGAWQWGVATMLLDAERRGSTITPAANGQRPVNVPTHTLRASAAYRVAAVPGLSLDAGVVREGRRAVLADNTLVLPAWTRLDAGATYSTRLAGQSARLRVAVDNLGDRRYWRESPTQFGHVYLYPGAPRTLRLSLNIDL